MTKNNHFEFLDNGVALAIFPNSGLNSTVVLAGVGSGGRHETTEEWGAAHFIEHMLYKGTKKWPSGKVLSAVIDEKGGQHNAYTDKELTNFYVKMPGHEAHIAVDIIHDMIENPLLRSTDIIKERPVIQEEISTYANDPNWILHELADIKMFGNGKVGRSITGTRDSVCFSGNTLRGFFRKHYTPENLVIILSGQINDKVITKARRKFGSLKPKALHLEAVEAYPKVQNGLFFKEGPTDRLHMQIRFPGVPKKSEWEESLDAISLALGGYCSARLYQSLREDKGLCYDVSCDSQTMSDNGYFVINTSLEKEKFAESFDAIVTEIQKLRKNGITEKELKTAKSYRCGTTLCWMDDPMVLAQNFAYQMLLTGSYESPLDEIERFQKIRLSRVQTTAQKFFDFSRMQVSVVGPKKEKASITRAYEERDTRVQNGK